MVIYTPIKRLSFFFYPRYQRAFPFFHSAGCYPAVSSIVRHTMPPLFFILYAGCYPAVSSIVPDIIRLFFPFRHPFTSRRCTGEPAPFRIMLGSLPCSFFARIFSFLLLSHPLKFAYIKYLLYLCTRLGKVLVVLVSPNPT